MRALRFAGRCATQRRSRIFRNHCTAQGLALTSRRAVFDPSAAKEIDCFEAKTLARAGAKPCSRSAALHLSDVVLNYYLMSRAT